MMYFSSSLFFQLKIKTMVVYRNGNKVRIECRSSGPAQDPYTVRIGTIATSTMDTTTTTALTSTKLSATLETIPLPKQCVGLFPFINETTLDPTRQPSLLKPIIDKWSSTPTGSPKVSDPTSGAPAVRPKTSLTTLLTSGQISTSSQNVKFTRCGTSTIQPCN